MPYAMPRLLYVSATDPTAPWSSISAALRQASSGDSVLVGPGRYTSSLTGEHFPLYVPPGVTLAGEGQGVSIIDGEGAMDVSFRPIQENQSLVLLGNGTTLRDFTVIHSGGHGVSHQVGARVLIMRNAIEQHGQHGIFLPGPQEAAIIDNHFRDNGTRQFRPTTPHPGAGRQGHHIFVQAKNGMGNSVLIVDNTMRQAFADGIALAVLCDEADGVELRAQVINNTIAQSAQRGLSICGSYGPSHNRVNIDIRHNIIRDNTGAALAAQAARSLLGQLICDSYLRLRVADNECHANGEGIVLFGGFGPAEDNLLDGTIVNNLITGTIRHAIRLIGGVGFGGYAALRNRVRAVIGRNSIEAADQVPIFVQGGIAAGQEHVTGNAVLAQMLANDLPLQDSRPLLLLDEGSPGNTVQFEDPVPSYTRTAHPIPYQV